MDTVLEGATFDTITSYGLIPFLLAIFALALLAKIITYAVARKQLGFSEGFALRTHRHLEGWYPATRKNDLKFHDLVKAILQLTYHEMYVARPTGQRRLREDSMTHVVNKVFLIEEAAQQMMDDTLRQTYLLNNYKDRPRLENVTRFVMNNNYYFNRVWAVIPVSALGRLFQTLPSLFIIIGILGTFLGITQGLPMLRSVDPADFAATQGTLAQFLGSMTFAMYASVVGIMLSILFTLVNTVLSLRSTQVQTFDHYTQALDLLWHSVDTHKEIEPMPETEMRAVRAAG